MKDRHEATLADPAIENAGRKKRTKPPPLWYRIIYDDAMVALVRLLGHDGLPYREMRREAEPLVQKFGRERLQAVADEIVETVGDGADEVVRLTEQARKLAIQLIGRPRTEATTVAAANTPTTSTSPESETRSPATRTRSTTLPDEPDASAASTTPRADEMVVAEAPIEDSPAAGPEPVAGETQEWTNYETSCVAGFLNEDRDFAGECLHLARLCCQQASRRESVQAGTQTEFQVQTLLLADQLERLVCEQNPLAEEDVSPFADLLEAALAQVDWQQLAESFLRRLPATSEAD